MPSRLAALAAKTTIRQYAQGAAQEATAPVADFLAPTVEVSSDTGYFKKYTEKSRFRVPDTRRAIGGRATELGFDASDATYNCKPNALDVPIDQLEKDASDEAGENLLQEASDLGAEVGGLSHEKTVVDLAVTTLTPGVANIDFAAGTDVIDQLDQRLIAIVKAAQYGSLMGVGLLFGPTFFRRLKNHPSIKGRFPIGKKEIVNPTVEDILSLFIFKPEARLSAMVYDKAPEGKAADIDFILDDKLIVFARKQNPTRRDPSFMKTFRRRGAWMAPRVYSRDDGRVEVAALDWSEDVQVTNSAAGQLLAIQN
jgi:hypothetical protein